MKRQEVLVAFDTPSDGRRRKLTRLLSRYGVRVQRSVFHLQGTATDLHRLWFSVERVTVAEEDSLLMVQVGQGLWRQTGSVPAVEVPLTRIF